MYKKKIVAINDRSVSKNRDLEAFNSLKKYGADIVFVDDCVDIADEDAFMQRFLQLEKQGPDSLPVNQDLLREAKDADIIISHISPVPTEVLKSAKHLEAVCIMRSGVENVNLESARRYGVKVINAPGRLAVPVSEFTVGMIICEMRNIARSHTKMMNRDFSKNFANSSYSVNLKGKNIGLVGCGAVGKRVARIMKAFEANVLVYDPYISDEALKEQGYIPVALNTLCSESDVVSIHYRLTPETEGMFGAEQFGLMKPTAFFINTARAGLVDEKSLLDALREHKIGGAALDVFHQEPLPANHPLLSMDNVTLTAHLAGTCSNLMEMTIDIMKGTLEKYFETGSWEHIVNR